MLTGTDKLKKMKPIDFSKIATGTIPKIKTQPKSNNKRRKTAPTSSTSSDEYDSESTVRSTQSNSRYDKDSVISGNDMEITNQVILPNVSVSNKFDALWDNTAAQAALNNTSTAANANTNETPKPPTIFAYNIKMSEIISIVKNVAKKQT